jgi:excinuclease ABC subunit B
VIIVASVSCIYGLGDPTEYEKVNKKYSLGQEITKTELMTQLISIYYERTNADLNPGTFRSLGNRIDIMPISENYMVQIEIFANKISRICLTDPVSMKEIKTVDEYFIFPAKHHVSDDESRARAAKSIKLELDERLKELESEGKILEADRLKRRTNYDLAMIKEVGFCQGIENYSRHFNGQPAGEPGHTLLSYFPKKKNDEPDFLLVIDESHVTLPQLRAMYAGDQSRKQNLVDYGFRLPSAKDNRPLKYEEFEARVGETIYVSATPGDLEKSSSQQIVEQIIRPTGLIDPILDVRPVSENKENNYPGQIHNFIAEVEKEVKAGHRVLATTLTKKMAENLSEYLKGKNIRAEYLHSDIKTIERIEILTKLRRGDFDCLVGVNLLREGLDLPEVSLIGILDADKEGFLRSETSLIQTIGRAARNQDGRVILYADRITGSMERAMAETERRRKIQTDYNKKHGITPTTIIKNLDDITDQIKKDHQKSVLEELSIDEKLFKKNPNKLIKLKENQMKEAVKSLDFETAAILRDELKILREKMEK